MNEARKVICQGARTYAGFPVGCQGFLVPVAGTEEAPVSVLAHLAAPTIINRALVDI